MGTCLIPYPFQITFLESFSLQLHLEQSGSILHRFDSSRLSTCLSNRVATILSRMSIVIPVLAGEILLRVRVDVRISILIHCKSIP